MDKYYFLSELDKRGISCSTEQLDLLWEFMHEVLTTNEKFNLTAIKDEETFVEKMIFDSAILLINQNGFSETMVDIGTGAGFPSVVLSILAPNLKVIAIDSTAKKINFINDFASKHHLNLTAITARAEDYAREHREQYSLVVARAVAPLNILLELSVPMLKVNGHLVAMKGPDFENELKDAAKAMDKLKCDIHYVYEDELPESGESRYFLHIRKLCVTPNKYPRAYGEIKNNPL